MAIAKLDGANTVSADPEGVQLAKINEVVAAVNTLQPLQDAIAAPAETAVTIEAVHAALVALGLIAEPA